MTCHGNGNGHPPGETYTTRTKPTDPSIHPLEEEEEEEDPDVIQEKEKEKIIQHPTEEGF